MKKIVVVYIIEIIIITLYLLLTNFSFHSIINAFFSIGLIGLCIGLFMYIYSAGAFSIIGYSFRRFNYSIAPKHVRKSMDENNESPKDLRIRNERYSFTLPVILASSINLIVSLALTLI
ncbi:DUF3899 domain-containing protein [Macrococcoides canis]|uniref:DUF3899 domain-containing protein n=1 Tax=Macrococcoides canis TaxID=1855823 RepID=UPI00165D725B|nr:DUF3899 domain-containing protein [Macrococcus canis]